MLNCGFGRATFRRIKPNPQQALNRLAAFAEFRGDEEAAIQRVTRDAIDHVAVLH